MNFRKANVIVYSSKWLLHSLKNGQVHSIAARFAALRNTSSFLLFVHFRERAKCRQMHDLIDQECRSIEINSGVNDEKYRHIF